MKSKIKVFIALCLILIFSFPLLACSISGSTGDAGGESSGGSQGGGSGGDSGGESGGEDDPYDDSGEYIEFEDGMLGIKLASYDSNSQSSLQKARTSIENLSKDILARLYAYYGEGINLDDVLNIEYKPSENLFLKNNNTLISPANFTAKTQTVSRDTIYNLTNQTINYGDIIFDSNFFDINGLYNLSNDEKVIIQAGEGENAGKYVVSIAKVSIKPEFDTYRSVQNWAIKNIKPITFIDNEINQNAQNFILNYYQPLTLALLQIFSNESPTELKKIQNNSEYDIELTNLLKTASHYGVLSNKGDEYYTVEIQKIVDCVLNCVIGKSIVDEDQLKIYKINNQGNFIAQNDSNNLNARYLDANLEKMNGYTLAINYENYNETANNLLQFSYDELSYYNIKNAGTDYSKNQGIINSLYNSIDDEDPANHLVVGLDNSISDYMLASGFKNYINIVEILVSTACNAILETEELKVYEAIPIGANYTYYNSTVVEPGTELEDVDYDDPNYVSTYNAMQTGYKHYESLVFYPKKGFNFDYLYIVFETLTGVDNGVDAYVRYHKENDGFVNFKNQDNSISDKYFVSNIAIPKGSYSEGFGLEFEFDMKKILKSRNFETPSYFVEPCSDAILTKIGAELTSDKTVEYSGENHVYKVEKFNHSKSGNEIDVLTYDCLEEEYIEIIFVYDRASVMNFGFYLSDMSIPAEA